MAHEHDQEEHLKLLKSLLDHIEYEDTERYSTEAQHGERDKLIVSLRSAIGAHSSKPTRPPLFDYDEETLKELGPGINHHLIISLGDCSFFGSCYCGEANFGAIRPDQSFEEFAGPWERHVRSL